MITKILRKTQGEGGKIRSNEIVSEVWAPVQGNILRQIFEEKWMWADEEELSLHIEGVVSAKVVAQLGFLRKECEVNLTSTSFIVEYKSREASMTKKEGQETKGHVIELWLQEI